MQVVDIKFERYYDSEIEICDDMEITVSNASWRLYINSEFIASSLDTNPTLEFSRYIHYWLEENK